MSIVGLKIGFTRTRKGMSRHQMRQLQRVLYALGTATEFHHGGAIGADLDAADFAQQALRIVVHPCPGVVATPETVGWIWREVFPPLKRNRHIAEEADILIAAPETDKEEQRSGTWATVRYARALGKPVVMLSRGNAS